MYPLSMFLANKTRTIMYSSVSPVLVYKMWFEGILIPWACQHDVDNRASGRCFWTDLIRNEEKNLFLFCFSHK